VTRTGGASVFICSNCGLPVVHGDESDRLGVSNETFVSAASRQGDTMYRSITALVLGLASLSSWSQPTVEFDLSAGSTFATGSTVTLTLVGSDFTNGLIGGGVDLQFNSAVMNLESVSVNSSVFDQTPGNGFLPAVITNTGGVDSTATGIDFAAFFNPTPVGTFDIASFQFLVEGSVGSSTNLTLSADCCGFAFTDGSFNTLTPTVDFSIGTQSVSVSAASVTSVPEIDPTSVMSALTLLLGSLAVLRGRRAGRIFARRF
jgi:hypothetical protein